MRTRILHIISACLIASPALAAVTPKGHYKKHLEKANPAMEREISRLNWRANELKQQVLDLKKEVQDLKTQELPPPVITIRDYNLGATVTTSPLVGRRASFDGSDLIVNLPSMNEDLHLLWQRQKLENHILGKGLNLPTRPHIVLSGQVDGQFVGQHPYTGPTDTDFKLSTAEIEALAEVSRWATGFMSINYDDSTPSDSGYRIGNSRLFLKRGWLTIGNLNCSPYYFTVGQMYVPFGQYSTYLVTSPMTKILGRTNARTGLFGFSYNDAYGEVYGFKGDADTGASGINQWGANLGYRKAWDKYKLNTSMGAITNIADSEGLQVTGNSTGFQGFGSSSATEKLTRRVPAFDFHLETSTGPYGFAGEFVTASRSFAQQNLSYNSHAALPQALHLEGSYRFHWLNSRPAAVALAYGKSWQALPLGLPEHSIAGVLTTSLWRSTIETVEFRHDNNYDSTDTFSGNGSPTPVNSAGSTQNTLTVQIGVYF